MQEVLIQTERKTVGCSDQLSTPTTSKEEMTGKYKSLREQLAKLTAEVEAARIEEKAEAINTCMELIADFELSAHDLGLVKTQALPPVKVKKSDTTFAVKMPKKVHPPKYVDPASGKTWSGLGHTPQWIVGNRDDYLIKAEPKRITQNNKHAA